MLKIISALFSATTIRDLKTNSFIQWSLKDAFISLLSDKQLKVSFHYRTSDKDGVLITTNGQADKYITLLVSASIFILILSSSLVKYNSGLYPDPPIAANTEFMGILAHCFKHLNPAQM